MCKFLLFAGTTEGRTLYERLSARGVEMDISVATEYEKELIEPLGGRIYSGRMTEEEMEGRIRAGGYGAVVDATHPYADIVTQNIRKACQETETLYIRLLRKESRSFGHLVSCRNMGEAIEYLRSHGGNVLSTIGSKQVSELKALPGYQDRVFARVLPLPEAIRACQEAGFSAKNIICMQGPFSQELNTAMLRQYDCRYLLTKNSGDAGGFEEKLRAAEEAGATVIVIERPVQEEGLSLEETEEKLLDLWGWTPPSPSKKTHFPLFVSLAGKKIVVAGGGAIAQRRVGTLCRFAGAVTVIAPALTEELHRREQSGEIQWESRKFVSSDLDGCFLAIAATNDRAVNAEIGRLARERGIWVSVADAKEECTLFFPAIVETEEEVIGIVGSGNAHHRVSALAERLREVIEDEDSSGKPR